MHLPLSPFFFFFFNLKLTTKTKSWCEEDYYLTRYCAEIVNSVTNAVFVWLAIKGLRNCWSERHDVIFAVTFTGYLCVGVGSFLFHATLWCRFFFVVCFWGGEGKGDCRGGEG